MNTNFNYSGFIEMFLESNDEFELNHRHTLPVPRNMFSVRRYSARWIDSFSTVTGVLSLRFWSCHQK